MGSGADVALETADAALLRNRVTDVAGAIRLSREAIANIRQNMGIALGLTGVFLVTTVLGVDRALACHPRRYGRHGSGHAQRPASSGLQS
jgi:cation transport ATPase